MSESIYRIQTRATKKNGISSAELHAIFKAMDLSAGHWYACPKGHLYCIGECGNPEESSKCLECGQEVGGRYSNLLVSNKKAKAVKRYFKKGKYH